MTQPPEGLPLDDPSLYRDGLRLLGRYIVRARVLVGIGQRNLAARAGVSQSSVARLEQGRAGGMPTRRLVAIGAGLGRPFPLGVCPHVHRCAWQPIEPPPPLTEQERVRELIVAHGIDSLPHWMLE